MATAAGVPCYRVRMNSGQPLLGRVRPLVEQPSLALRAVELLRTPQALLPLGPAEAGHVVAQMGLVHFAAGTTVLREGDGSRPDFMLLLLEGEVEVDTGASGLPDRVALAVLGPGSIIGEMSLLDGTPRSATCTAVGAVLAAGLSRQGLERLIDEQPRAAAKLMMGLAQRMADRLRGLGDQVQMYAQLADRAGRP
jgi:CRP/FNR family cyclic AMP-dependent transcriptional regulator